MKRERGVEWGNGSIVDFTEDSCTKMLEQRNSGRERGSRFSNALIVHVVIRSLVSTIVSYREWGYRDCILTIVVYNIVGNECRLKEILFE